MTTKKNLTKTQCVLSIGLGSIILACLPQGVRLAKLNAIAISQMKILVADDGIKRLPGVKKGSEN
jgi:hypothetical protein